LALPAAQPICLTRVLFRRGVGERNELVHLEEGPRRFRHLHAHPTPACGVAVDVLVLDGFVEDRGQAVDELADRRWAKRALAPPARVAQDGSGADRRA
jgi:hypothetical protein